MKKYKIELHAHTPVISLCGRVPPRELAERYHRAGYQAITVTDHFAPDILRARGIDGLPPRERLDAFLEGYRQVKAAAEPLRMRVYYGAELRFFENNNDYLLYGFPEELLAQPEEVWHMGIAAFSPVARQAGALLIQAHPFRTGCVPVLPTLVDGLEAVNCHYKHNNHNDLAMATADAWGLLKTCGTDFHDPDQPCIGGIQAAWLPENSMELAALLRSGEFELLAAE